jgi:gamma-glutamylputrescine oxidase
VRQVTNKTIVAQDQVFWYLNRTESSPSLCESLEADVVVIGGGMAGLSAAEACVKKGKKVVLLEAYFCGAGASGKSSGFITPNSEISLSTFIDRYGFEGGKAIWKSIEDGAELIRANIQENNLSCDYQPEKTLVVANSKRALRALEEEQRNLEKCGYASEYLTKKRLTSVLGSKNYYGGVTYSDSFGINSYAYCQGMKDVLEKSGVQIYEETPVISFTPHSVKTQHATIKAKHIIVCTDRFTPSLGALSESIYHMQTFLMVSQVLTPEEIKKIFPQESFMVWDTDLIYNYYRISHNRLLLGGSSLFYSYDRKAAHENHTIFNKLTEYYRKKFPQIDLQFEQMWPGLIGISKDIAPLCGRDEKHASIYYLAAAAGLPIAAGLGQYAADHIFDNRNDLKDYFSPYRHFPISGVMQKLLGTRLSFALSHALSMNLFKL